MAFAQGHVVDMRRSNGDVGAGVVLLARDHHVWVAPVGGYKNQPTHRAEVRITDFSEATEMGISLKYPVVRCQHLIKIDVSRLQPPIGMTPPDLMRQIVQSARIEAKTQATEMRLMYRHQHTETMVQM